MSWTRVLLLPHVIRAGMRAPRGEVDRWDRYWAGVQRTGDGGDVLWDSSRPEEAAHYVELLADHADARLPVLDVGCGNGRFTRALAGRFPRAMGVDVSPHAVTRAAAEAAESAGSVVGRAPEFRAVDMTLEDAARPLAAELGPSNVFIRGVLHVLDLPARRRLARNVQALTGSAGAVLVAETNYRGPLLGYLESLGGGLRGLPSPVERAIASGVPAPTPFGAAELEECFDPADWERVVVDEHAEISAVPMPRRPIEDAPPERIPGFVALLRGRSPRSRLDVD